MSTTPTPQHQETDSPSSARREYAYPVVNWGLDLSMMSAYLAVYAGPFDRIPTVRVLNPHPKKSHK